MEGGRAIAAWDVCMRACARACARVRVWVCVRVRACIESITQLRTGVRMPVAVAVGGSWIDNHCTDDECIHRQRDDSPTSLVDEKKEKIR